MKQTIANIMRSTLNTSAKIYASSRTFSGTPSILCAQSIPMSSISYEVISVSCTIELRTLSFMKTLSLSTLRINLQTRSSTSSITCLNPSNMCAIVARTHLSAVRRTIPKP